MTRFTVTHAPAKPAAPPQSSKPSEDGAVTAPPPPPTSPQGGGVDSKFVDLAETLGGLWKKQPLLSHVGSELMKIAGSRARTLNGRGVVNFKACEGSGNRRNLWASREADDIIESDDPGEGRLYLISLALCWNVGHAIS